MKKVTKTAVAFGNYLLSDERKELYKLHPHFNSELPEERLSRVSDADVSNFEAKTDIIAK